MLKEFKTLFMVMVLMFAVIPVTFADNTSVEIETDDDNLTVEVQDGNSTIIVEVESQDEGSEDSQEGSDVDEPEVVTEEEANILSTQVGAQVRLIQLQKRIEGQAEAGQIIVDKIEEVKPDFDTTRLNEIIDEFYVLVETIESYDLNQDQQVVVSDYVGMKKQAIELTQEFKKISKDALSEGDKQMLRERAQERIKEKKQEKQEKLEKLKVKYDVEKLRLVAEGMGYDVEAAKLKIQNGELTLAQVREQLEAGYANLSEEDKQALNDKIKEARIKDNIKAKEKQAELKVRAETRKEELKANIEAQREELKARIEARKEEFKANKEAQREQIKADIEARKEEFKANKEAQKEQMKADIEARKDGKVKVETDEVEIEIEEEVTVTSE